MNPLGPLPSLARRTIRTTRATIGFGLETTTTTATTIVRGIAAGQRPSELAEQLAADSSDRLRYVVAVVRETRGAPLPDHVSGNGARGNGSRPPWRPRTTLPEMFAALLDTSADVHQHQNGHPAYFHVMAELAPDEARILRLFARQGAQPALDVRTKRPFGVGSKLVAPGITMIGLHAGCAEPDRVPSYLNNLNRLGFIWFSREAMADIDGYQVLEAQPEVLDARQSVKRATTVLRSIELTAFGKNFCALVGLMDGAAVTARASVGEVNRALPPPDGR